MVELIISYSKFIYQLPILIKIDQHIKDKDLPLYTISKLNGSPSYISVRCFIAMIRQSSRIETPTR